MSTSLLGYLSSFQSIVLLAFGFGFVIFWHELGHFLAAKWADVKVEQFAVGFGQAMVSWRKGLGFTRGSSNELYQKRLKEYLETQQTQTPQMKDAIPAEPTEAQLSSAAAALNISETEYRLNWIPLGGYVKMLGQDDLKPGQTVSDPRSYNNKTISQRMVIVSAGVVMNVILAAIGFVYIFTVGFEVTQPIVGMVVPGAPAQKTYKIVDGKHVITPLRVGDRVLTLNGRAQSDFDKIKLNTLLLIAGDTVPMKVRHLDGSTDDLYVTPLKTGQGSEFPQIGIGEYPSLKGLPLNVKEPESTGKENPEFSVIKNGDVITAIDGKPVGVKDFYKLDEAIQKAAGQPVPVAITNGKGATRPGVLRPHFMERFSDDPINFAGMEMLPRIDLIQADSPLLKDLDSGDVITNIADPSASGGQMAFPTRDEMIKEFNNAGEHGTELVITVRRGDREIQVKAKPSVKLQNGKYGFGIAPDMAEGIPVVASTMLDGSPAKAANVRGGSRITGINGLPVHNWFDVYDIMSNLKAGQPVTLATRFDGKKQDYRFADGLTQPQIDEIRSNRLQSFSTTALVPDDYLRKAPNLWVASKWGAEETRDAILQVYQTVRSMSKGSISVKEISGPVGILGVGYKIAQTGFTKLVWFLSIISANLAVMNFLPIPIVDGGLFTFLIIEKIKGSPISQRTQAIAQVVGLALLLSVFLFATYQDVFTRLPILFR